MQLTDEIKALASAQVFGIVFASAIKAGETAFVAANKAKAAVEEYLKEMEKL